jgi:hypothetical protein
LRRIALLVIPLTACGTPDRPPSASTRDVGPFETIERDAGALDAGPSTRDAGGTREPDRDGGAQGHPIWLDVTPAGSETTIEGDARTLDYVYALPSTANAQARVFTSAFVPELVRVEYRTTGDRLVAFVDETTVVLHEAEVPGTGGEVTGEVLLDFVGHETFGFIVSGGVETMGGRVEGTLSARVVPWAPQIAPMRGGQRYVEADGVLPMGDGTVQTYHLHVQALRRIDGQWHEEPFVYDDGRTPTEVLVDSADLWIRFYRSMIARGTARSEIRKLAQGIQSDQDDSGVYVETNLSACGYNGSARTITCGPGTSRHLEGTMAHESIHGWEWLTFEGDPALSIVFRDAFTRYANLVYHTRLDEPEKLMGDGWRLTYLNYGLQNSIEWGSEMFRDWLYGPPGGGWPGNWQFTRLHLPEYAEFFDCLWLDGDALFDCKARAFGDGPLIARPEVRPQDTSIAVAGFTAAESAAIWNVCARTDDAAQYTAQFDAIVRRVAPNLPGSPAAAYELAVGDCNHDGIEDWLCWYTGRGPEGVGNGNYRWNVDNTEGAYTFVVSGKAGDDYAEYLQDPYLTLPSINGSLAQPMFREWQGQYGSCNGALRIWPMGDTWIRAYFGALLD